MKRMTLRTAFMRMSTESRAGSVMTRASTMFAIDRIDRAAMKIS